MAKFNPLIDPFGNLLIAKYFQHLEILSGPKIPDPFAQTSFAPLNVLDSHKPYISSLIDTSSHTGIIADAASRSFESLRASFSYSSHHVPTTAIFDRLERLSSKRVFGRIFDDAEPQEILERLEEYSSEDVGEALASAEKWIGATSSEAREAIESAIEPDTKKSLLFSLCKDIIISLISCLLFFMAKDVVPVYLASRHAQTYAAISSGPRVHLAEVCKGAKAIIYEEADKNSMKMGEALNGQIIALGLRHTKDMFEVAYEYDEETFQPISWGWMKRNDFVRIRVTKKQIALALEEYGDMP